MSFPEILFPSEFTREHPIGDPWKDVSAPYPIQVPFDTLTHITHDHEASKICKKFEFKAGPKIGKVLAYDGRPCGESFKFVLQEGKYHKITSKELVFPGFYSWWSIEPHPVEISVTLEGEGYDVPDYLKTHPYSRYGNHAFSYKLSHLLTAYAESRDCSTSKICIRKGGTLRYKQEICYVLIICNDSDSPLSAFEQIEPKSKLFHTNSLIDASGKIDVITAIPTFNPEHIITSAFSYETLAFGFYFPQERFMRVGPECCSVRGIGHDYCIKKQPPPDGGKWKCPNDRQRMYS